MKPSRWISQRIFQRIFQRVFQWLITCLLIGAPRLALAVDVIDRSRALSLEPLQTAPVVPKTIVNTPDVVAQPSDALEADLAKRLREGDCESILKEVPSHGFETVRPQLLAVAATCEPPGKDPEKMFVYAESKDPSDDIILLLHARYDWKKKNPQAEQLFAKLYDRTTDARIKELAGQYILAPPMAPIDRFHGANYVVSGQVGGIEQANPLGVSISDPAFGNSASTAGTAQIAGTFHKSIHEITYGLDYIANDTTYWATHTADLLTQDLDLTVERSLTENLNLGLRPYGSFYLLQGTRYYSLTGVGLTGRTLSSTEGWFDQWLQLSFYQDKFYSADASPQSGSHVRIDWQGSFKPLAQFSPTLILYIDHANAGVDLTGRNYVPYSHNEYGLAVSFVKPVHRYSVGLLVRGSYREDTQDTSINEGQGQMITKRRRDFQVVIQPSLIVPLKPGLDLFMYFTSNSISSSLQQSDGLDRNISDNLVSASLRFSFANF